MDYMGQWGEGALDTPGPLNGIERSECHSGPGALKQATTAKAFRKAYQKHRQKEATARWRPDDDQTSRCGALDVLSGP
jgi:hypothetical protein